jgi:hypothetical protein
MNAEAEGDLSVLKNHLYLKPKMVKDVAGQKRNLEKIDGKFKIDYNSNQIQL